MVEASVFEYCFGEKYSKYFFPILDNKNEWTMGNWSNKSKLKKYEYGAGIFPNDWDIPKNIATSIVITEAVNNTWHKRPYRKAIIHRFENWNDKNVL